MAFNTGLTDGQEPIEKQLSKEDLSQPSVATLAERLRILRRNAQRYGPKHPAMPNVLKQIATLEEQLRELIGKSPSIPSTTIPSPVVEANERPLPPKFSPSTVDQKPEKRIERISEWGFAPWSQWPANVQDLLAEARKVSQYQEAYPLLGLKQIVAVGPMPGLGLHGARIGFVVSEALPPDIEALGESFGGDFSDGS